MRTSHFLSSIATSLALLASSNISAAQTAPTPASDSTPEPEEMPSIAITAGAMVAPLPAGGAMAAVTVRF